MAIKPDHKISASVKRKSPIPHNIKKNIKSRVGNILERSREFIVGRVGFVLIFKNRKIGILMERGLYESYRFEQIFFELNFKKI